MQTCEFCGTLYEEGQALCPNCGKETGESKTETEVENPSAEPAAEGQIDVAAEAVAADSGSTFGEIADAAAQPGGEPAPAGERPIELHLDPAAVQASGPATPVFDSTPPPMGTGAEGAPWQAAAPPSVYGQGGAAGQPPPPYGQGGPSPVGAQPGFGAGPAGYSPPPGAQPPPVGYSQQAGAQGVAAAAGYMTPEQVGDFQKNRDLAILAYLGTLILVPAIAAPNSPYVKFHMNQALVLLIMSTIVSVVGSGLNAIPFIGPLLYLAINVCPLVFWIMGLVNASSGKMQPLPVIGSIQIVRY